jgi:hypothetical protein
VGIGPGESIYAALIVIALFGLAAYFAWRQCKALRDLPRQQDLSVEDRRYLRGQALRRLVSCGLMVILAGMLVGSYLLEQERRAGELGGRAAAASGESQPDRKLNPEQKRFLNQYSTFWIIFSLLLFGLVSLAFIDVLAIRRFWLRNYRQIQADRRAMIEREVARFRSQRNGHD